MLVDLVNLLPISYIICIWINCYRFGLHPYAPPRGLSSVHELSSSNKTMVCAYILTLEKCRDFFENSNGKCAKGSLYRWKTKHLMGEHPFTCRVNTLFTHGVKALFTQAVHAFRGKMTMKMPWNKSWFFAVFQNTTRAGRKNRKNKASGKFNMSANQDNSLPSVRWTTMLLWLPRNGWCIEP